ncbi:hypothetical protein GCM10009413_32850 [Tatumella punctata]
MTDLLNFNDLSQLANKACYFFSANELVGGNVLKLYTSDGLVAYKFISSLGKFFELNPPSSDESWLTLSRLTLLDDIKLAETAHLFYRKTGF